MLLAVGAWVRPRVRGPALILVGALFAAWMLVAADRELAGVLAGLAIAPVPLIVAGVFFHLAGNTTTRARLHR